MTMNIQDKHMISATYQSKVGKLVDDEILTNANEFMTLIQEDIETEWFENFDNIYDESIETIEDWFMHEANDDIIEEHIYHYINKKIDDNYTIGMALDDLSTEDKKNLAEQCGFEASPHEILEWWLVTEWMANKLQEYGEPIAQSFYGFNVWGRTCSGQAILLDNVICKIYDETKRHD